MRTDKLFIGCITATILIWLAIFASGTPVQDGKNWVGLSTEMTGTQKWTEGSRFYTTDTLRVYLRSQGSWSAIVAESDITNTIYSASTMTVTYGVLSEGTVTALSTLGSGTVTIAESVGANALEMEVLFPAVTTFNNVLIKGRYDGGVTTDNVTVEIYNVSTTSWNELGRMATASTYAWYSYAIFEAAEFIDASDQVILRFRHGDTGKSGHNLYLDYVIVQEAVGIGGGSVTDHGSLTGLSDLDHPFSAITGSITIEQLPNSYATTTSFSAHTALTSTAHGGPYGNMFTSGATTSGAVAIFTSTTGTQLDDYHGTGILVVSSDVLSASSGTGHVKMSSGVVSYETMTTPVANTCTGTDKISAYNASTGAFTCSTDQTSGGLVTSKLTATYTNSTATGTEVTGLQLSLSATTTYRYSCFLLARNATVANAIDIGVNYTGTQQAFTARLDYSDTGSNASTGTADEEILGDGSETIVAQCNTITESTTTPNLNCITSFTGATSDHLLIVQGTLVTGTAGDLEIWAASESTTAASLSVGSNCIAFQF